MKKAATFFITSTALIILAGCSSKQIEIHQSKDIVGLASPVQLNNDSTIIYFEDYFVDVSKIESVKLNGKTISLSEDHKKAIIKSEESFPRLMEMEVIVNGISYQILCKKSEKINKTISFDPKGKKYKNVRIGGEMLIQVILNYVITDHQLFQMI